jgi:DNA primase
MTDTRPLRYIRKNFAWREYIEQNYKFKRAAMSELRICCPACGDQKFKLYVNVDKGVFICFKCDFSCKKGYKDVFDFVAITESISRRAAIEQLLLQYKTITNEEFEDAINGLLDTTPDQQKKQKLILPCSVPKEALPLTSEAGPYWDYMVDRGLTEREITRLLKASYIPDESLVLKDSKGMRKGDIGQRILWPLYTLESRLCSWQARSTTNEDPKYLNAPETDISSTLWPFVPPYTDTVILVEGVLDCVAMRRLDKPHAAYATLSKHISAAQIEVLKMWGVKRITLLWDRRDAIKEMARAVDMLDDFEVVYADTLSWPSGIDCGDLLKESSTDQQLYAATHTINPKTADIIRWKLQ